MAQFGTRGLREEYYRPRQYGQVPTPYAAYMLSQTGTGATAAMHPGLPAAQSQCSVPAADRSTDTAPMANIRVAGSGVGLQAYIASLDSLAKGGPTVSRDHCSGQPNHELEAPEPQESEQAGDR